MFAGTPVFSVRALDALYAAGHEIVGVYTQPDRPSGRGQKLSASPVAQRAAALGLPIFKPEKLRGNLSAIEQLRDLSPDLMVVVAYGLILPQAVLDLPRHGCFNIHASLLPRWRGAAPIQRAILAGDRQTGITIMQMDAGLDTGAMLLAESVPIEADTTAAALHDALSALGARLIVAAVARLQSGTLTAEPQPAQGATYAAKLDKAEARLDWRRTAVELGRAVRAFNPAPVAWTEHDGERLRIHAARPLATPGDAIPGTVITADATGIAVATGDGVLAIDALQWPGGRVIDAAQAATARSLLGRLLQ